MDRRSFLRSSLVGCSLAAHPVFTPVVFASAPTDSRLVVLVLRGAMDGLDAIQPLGDPHFRALRPRFEAAPHDLDGFFSLHGALGGLLPLWRRRELAFVHAVSTPYRGRRSHFEGQDILETGAGGAKGDMPRDGWLNRVLGLIPDSNARFALAAGHENLLLLDGQQPKSVWTPAAAMAINPELSRLMRAAYEDDPLFHPVAEEAFLLSEESAREPIAMTGRGTMAEMDRISSMQPIVTRDTVSLARFVAKQMRNDIRIAAFSISGWDTHRYQAKNIGKALGSLSEAITTLHAGLGDVWNKTVIVAVTEFGRTVRENGTGGTDHGTGGAMIYAGGAVNGGRVYGEWPGLGSGQLYRDRDLLPTRDMRSVLAWTLRDHLSLKAGALERAVFPDLDMGNNLQIIA